jgi:SAM-dependent methyltransferase
MVGSTSTLDAATPGDRSARSDSWYLDPLVARQKADAFMAMVERWRDPVASGPTLKTDLFEEANGEDALVPRLDRRGRIVACDLDLRTARRAQRRFAASGLGVFVGDLRRIGLRDGVLDLAVSPSTLDHFDDGADIEVALREIRRVLKPGGTAVVILDNPLNPLYHLLRLGAKAWAPFTLGRTLGRRGLESTLERAGFTVLGHDYAIHNPRGVLTVVNLVLRRVLGRHADGPIRALLGLFALLDRLPTRGITACFVAVGARRLESDDP